MLNCVYNNKKIIKLIEWKIKPENRVVQFGTLLFVYKECDHDLQETSDELKYKSNLPGIIIEEILKEENGYVMPGDVLFKYNSCPHETIMKDLCADCGQNLLELDDMMRRKVTQATNVSIVHSVPELRVSKEKAEIIGRADEERLLKDRKLVLLVDLDQTIIHTTNTNISPNLKDVHHFQLYGPNTMWYHTKFRPYTMEFLEKISKKYELHICTFGARRYAHEIATALDPKEKYFPKDRILSRDECFNPYSKTGNMKSLFPCGDSMVCIIDDREDVWNYAPNMVQVKPYIYFRETGDINAPERNHKNTKAANISEMTNKHYQKTQDQTDDISQDDISFIENFLKDDDHSDQGKAMEVCVEHEEKSQDKNVQNNADEESVKIDQLQGKREEEKLENNEESCKEETKEELKDDKEKVSNTKDEEIVDSDDYLLHLEDILIKIHDEFYNEYDQKMKYKTESEQIKLPDLKELIPLVKKKVLTGVNAVFSSVIPTNIEPKDNKLVKIARTFGATVTQDVITEGSPRTTHLVAGRWGTAKVNKCIKAKNIWIVNPNWLYTCAERWEKVDEMLFQLDKNDDFRELSKYNKIMSNTKSENELGKPTDSSEQNIKKNQCPVYDQVTGKRIRKV